VVPQREIVLSLAGLRLRDRYDDIQLEIGLGEIVGITGSSSSGKVALAETVAGMRRPDAGTITVGGEVLRPGPAHALRSGIGFVPQDPRLIPSLSLAENVTLPVTAGLSRYGMILPSVLNQAGRQAMEEFRIGAKGPGQPVGRLTGGDARKAALARASATQPKALVLIDPTTGADTRSSESLLDSVMAAASRGAAVLLVSDELEDLRICDRLVVLRHGRIALESPRGWNDGEIIAAIEGVAL
jgi:simple sugar transport system ATP-binding protein